MAIQCRDEKSCSLKTSSFALSGGEVYSILGWAIFLGFQLAFRERPGCELKSVVIDRLVGGAEGRHCCRVRCTPAGARRGQVGRGAIQ